MTLIGKLNADVPTQRNAPISVGFIQLHPTSTTSSQESASLSASLPLPLSTSAGFTPSWPNMAVSPVVTHTVEVPQPQTLQRAISSPLKNVVASQTSSSNGTPKPPVTSVPAPATMPATLDLAEQMNDEEKRKYVKGDRMHTYSRKQLLLTLYRQEAR